jgi:catechol 2,3-dioxygenase-like lactoylglutathione lyase family enzyme
MSAAEASGRSWASSTEHVGITVADLDRSLDFWTRLTGAEVMTRRVLDAPHIGELVGYPGDRIEIALLELPGGLVLELLRYLDTDAQAYEPGTAHPGNVHVCFVVEDMHESWAHAIECGAKPASEQPVRVPVGPQEGAYVAYLQTPDGVSFELRQPAPPRTG